MTAPETAPGQAMAAPEDKTPPEYQLLGWAATIIAEAPGMQADEWETATRNWLGAYAALTATPALAAQERPAPGGDELARALASTAADRNQLRIRLERLAARWRRDVQPQPDDTDEHRAERRQLDDCARSLAVILDEHPASVQPAEPQAAPELAEAVAERDLLALKLRAVRAILLDQNASAEDARGRAAAAAYSETPAPDAKLRDGIAALAADITASADATRPSAKSRAEDECAAMLRQLLEG